MKKTSKLLLTGIIAVSLLAFAGCSSSESADTDTAGNLTESQEKYFEITDLIHSGEYDQAWTEMSAFYADTDYTGTDGFNKMNQYRLYYETIGEYDESIEVLFDYIEENGYTQDSDDQNYDYVVDCISNIIDNVSDENKAIAADLTGVVASSDAQAEGTSSGETEAADDGSGTENETAAAAGGTGEEAAADDVVVASVAEVINAYNANEFSADQQYKGKTLQVTGLVYDITSTDDGGALVQLMPSGDDSSWDEVHCYFYDEAELQKVAGLTTGFDVTIEGYCEGYDGFYSVEMSDCRVIG